MIEKWKALLILILPGIASTSGFEPAADPHAPMTAPPPIIAQLEAPAAEAACAEPHPVCQSEPPHGPVQAEHHARMERAMREHCYNTPAVCSYSVLLRLHDPDAAPEPIPRPGAVN